MTPKPINPPNPHAKPSPRKPRISIKRKRTTIDGGAGEPEASLSHRRLDPALYQQHIAKVKEEYLHSPEAKAKRIAWMKKRHQALKEKNKHGAPGERG